MELNWKTVEDYYLARLQKEKEEKERAQDLVKELTGQMEKKNKEIQFLDFKSNVLIYTLKAACDEIDKLRKKE